MASNGHSSSQRAIDEQAAHWIARRDAGLSAVEAQTMRLWAEADPRHQASIEQFDATWSALAATSRLGKAGEFENEVAKFTRRRRLATVTKCAGLLAIAGLSFGVWRQFQPAAESQVGNTMVHLPERRTLPDGSVVELRSNSQIEVAYSKAQRGIVLLRGEAHFDVTKDPNRPFVVSAKNVAVRAVGTAFDVQIESANVQVLVTEGTVAVGKANTDSSNNPAPQSPAAVGAGSAVTVDTRATTPVSAVRTVPPAEISERLAWRKTRIEFDKTPLFEAVAVMNRYAPSSSPRLMVKDSQTGTIGVIGVFRPDNIEGFLALLEAGFDIKAEKTGDRIILRKFR